MRALPVAYRALVGTHADMEPRTGYSAPADLAPISRDDVLTIFAARNDYTMEEVVVKLQADQLLATARVSDAVLGAHVMHVLEESARAALFHDVAIEIEQRAEQDERPIESRESEESRRGVAGLFARGRL